MKGGPESTRLIKADPAYVAGARKAGLSADRVGGAAAVRASLAVHGLDAGSHRG